MTADEARAYLSRLSSHQGQRVGDTAYMNPEFAIRLATAIQQARNEGMAVSVFSGFREPNNHPSAYDLKGDSSHSYGLAADVSGIGPAGSATATRWRQIAEGAGLSSPYDPNGGEWNHWQIGPKLETDTALRDRLVAAKASGNINQMWAAYTPESAGGGQGQYTADQVFNAIYGQESNYGQNAVTSPRGAHGGMQIIPETFARYALPGENIDNPADNLAVGHRIVNDLMEKFGNDPAKVAVAYFSGEGNVAKAGATPFLADSGDGSKKVSSYVNDIMKRLGSPTAYAGGAAAPGAVKPAATAQTPPDPQAQIGSAIGQALGSLSNSETSSAFGGGGQVSDPPDAPPIRTPAMGADFMPPPQNPVPANLAGGLGSQLGSLAIQPQTQPLGDPSITQGAPSMTSMLGQIGTPNDPTAYDPRRTGAINPYARAPRIA
jgi:hypothetical protein